eukprot:TRINITY_DN17236_c0_g1_i2.p1 TRINITY_DN17236_c0_g1~~TRINITY_DN17236_c0_g1_i2.p1  ORF type:complete len:983 (+),score=217.14 TRINITY_DN17236_c0_g1_i2:641-3589(+)
MPAADSTTRWLSDGAPAYGDWRVAAAAQGQLRVYSKVCAVPLRAAARAPLRATDRCWQSPEKADAVLLRAAPALALRPVFVRVPPVWRCPAALPEDKHGAWRLWRAVRGHLEAEVYPGRQYPPSECAPWSDGLCPCFGGQPAYRPLPLGLPTADAAKSREAARRSAVPFSRTVSVLVFVLAGASVWDRVVLLKDTWAKELRPVRSSDGKSALACIVPRDEVEEVSARTESLRDAVVGVATPSSRDSWGNMWEKARLAWVAVSHFKPFQWYMKADTDSWVGVGNLHALLRWYDASRPLYLGHVVLHRWVGENLAFNAGAGYVLSGESVRRVAPLLEKILDQPDRIHLQCNARVDGSEDAAMSQCLREVGALPRDTTDAWGRHRFNCFSDTTHRHSARSATFNGWYWSGLPPDAAEGSHHLSPFPVVLHNIKGKYAGERMRLLDRVHGCAIGNASCITEPPSQELFRYDPLLIGGVDWSRNSVAACERLPAAQCAPADPADRAQPISPHDLSLESLEAASPVRVGLCRNPTKGISEFARVLIPAALPGRALQWVQLDRDGTGDAGAVDILFCLGYFYNGTAIVNPRLRQLADAVTSGRAVDAPRHGWHGNTFWPKDLRKLLPHRHRPFLVAFSFEPWDVNKEGCRKFDLLFQCCADTRHMSSCPQVHMPYASLAAAVAHRRVPKAAAVEGFSSRRFCLFLASACFSRTYNGEAMVRVAFFDYLSERASASGLEVDSLGGCRRNGERLSWHPRRGQRGGNWTASQQRLMSGYRFVIAMENHRKRGWISERLVDAAAAGAIPIYFGAPDVDRYYNPRRLVAVNLTSEEVGAVRGIVCRWFPASRRCPLDPVAAALATPAEQVAELYPGVPASVREDSGWGPEAPQSLRASLRALPTAALRARNGTFPVGRDFDAAVTGASAALRAFLRSAFSAAADRVLQLEASPADAKAVASLPALRSSPSHVLDLATQAAAFRRALSAYRSDLV